MFWLHLSIDRRLGHYLPTCRGRTEPYCGSVGMGSPGMGSAPGPENTSGKYLGINTTTCFHQKILKLSILVLLMMANLLVNLVSEQLPFRRLQLTSRVPFRKILFFGANSGMRVASNFLIEYSESAWKVPQVWLFSKFQVHFWRFYNQKPDFRRKAGSCFCENTHRFQTEPKLDLKNSGFEVPMLKRSLVFFWSQM